ncbi:hypothetical protein LSTR_LSTR006996 [Laodelphax striatellus]|uniref:Chitin-binding type-2 domain-containing protein n=1 Tax=Laodelphax striatellus TaxID=195883 RepID=A0A482WJI5_LAOST|nr:hypothetical protein LSTR_LSTR006996 [Laodelphax striatellus]
MWRRNVNNVLPWITFICLITILTKGATGLRGSAVVLQAKAKAAELKEAGIEEAAAETEEVSVNGTSTNTTQVKVKSLLTGIPQKDYIYDPNLPRELNGHNLTNYPFYNAVPPDIEFDCDGLHDGFYASVPHKCQVYHHCLFGTRYDFLCANYTAFDQKTFICHFVSEVDCQNSPKYFKRNEALYKAATTSPPPTTARPTTTTTTTTTTQAPPPGNGAPRNRGHRPFRGRGRPYRRRRPVVYYYYDEDYDGDGDDYYYDDEPPERERQQARGKGNRKHQQSSHGQGYRDDDSPKGHGRPYAEPEAQQASSTEAVKPSVRPSSSQSTLSGSSVYSGPRVPPKIRRPVPINERDKYDYTQQTTDVGPAPTAETAKNKKGQQARRPVSYDDYYDDEEDDDYPEEQPPKYKKMKTSDYEAEPSTTSDSRRPVTSRHRLRVQNQNHRRPDRYDDDYEEEYDRGRKRKEPARTQDDANSQRSSRFRSRGKLSRDEEAVPAERPGYISSGRAAPNGRKKPQNDYQRPPGRKNQDRRPIYEDDDYEEYYDNEEDDVEDEKISRRNHRNRQRDEYHDSKNDRRSNNKGSSTNSETKSTSQSRNSENAKVESETRNKPQSSSNSKSSSNDDSFSKETSQTKDTRRPSNNKQVIDNQKLSSTTTEKYVSDEEYDDDEDYEEPRQTSSTKTVDGKLSRKEYSKPSQTQSNANDQVNDEPQSANHSNEESSKNTYSSSTTPASNNQEQSTYRSPGLFIRSRTSPSTSSQTQTVTTPTTLSHRFSSTSSDNQDSDLINRYKSEGRSKTVSTTPSNFYRKQSIAPAVNEDNSEEISSTKPLKSSSSIYDSSTTSPSKEITELPAYNTASRSSSAVLYRRPLKSTASNTIETTTSYSDAGTYSSSQRPVAAIGYRRIVKPSDSDEKFLRKEQSFPPTGLSGNFRRPIIKGADSDRAPQLTSEQGIDDSVRKSTQQPFPSPSVNGNNQYRKVVKPAFDTSTPENAYNTRTNYEENVNKPAKLPPSAPSTLNYRRPSVVSKPVVEDYPAEYDDGQKVVPEKQPALGLTYRRPLKTQKLQDNQDNAQDSIESSDQPISTGNIYQKPLETPSKIEGSTIISLKSHYGFINSNRPKQSEAPTAPEAVSYNTRLLENVNSEKALSFPRQPPRSYDSTAPGPSAPEEPLNNRNQNYRQNQYNEQQNPTTNFDLNIPEEEYDVTLNDALQPSTLHPTRSLADYPIQARLKSRGYQSRVTHPSRGAASYLLPSASQQYVARVQTTRSQDKVVDSESSQSKQPSQTSADQEEYEAVVLSAPQYDTGSLHRWVSQQRQIRPAEWYW